MYNVTSMTVMWHSVTSAIFNHRQPNKVSVPAGDWLRNLLQVSSGPGGWGGGTPIWNRRECSSEILNLTPKGDRLKTHKYDMQWVFTSNRLLVRHIYFSKIQQITLAMRQVWTEKWKEKALFSLLVGCLRRKRSKPSCFRQEPISNRLLV